MMVHTLTSIRLFKASFVIYLEVNHAKPGHDDGRSYVMQLEFDVVWCCVHQVEVDGPKAKRKNSLEFG